MLAEYPSEVLQTMAPILCTSKQPLFTGNILVTPTKEMVMEPTLSMDTLLSDLLQRLVQVDTTKWQALQELGLPPLPDSGAQRGR